MKATTYVSVRKYIEIDMVFKQQRKKNVITLNFVERDLMMLLKHSISITLIYNLSLCILCMNMVNGIIHLQMFFICFHNPNSLVIQFAIL